ncbi:MAG: FN3 associated domain-containing protein [Chitinophagaceae bacterium]
MQRWKNISFNILLFLNCFLLFLLLFESRMVAPAWLQVFGRMHPLIVHFPIVLVLLYFGFLFLTPAAQRKENWYITAMDIMLIFSSLSAVVAALMGLFLSREAGYDQDALAWHKWMGVITSFVLFLLYAFRNQLYKVPFVRYIFVAATCATVVLAGHLGGNITHGENYVLAPVTPVSKKLRASFEDAFVYADLVQPIIESKCISCHNSSKAKGELIMETKELLLKGGKDGKLWDTTKADLGLMMQRIHLPEEEKEHMPPTGKPQLTNQELEVLYAWIKSGASFEQRVIELAPTDTLRIMAAKILKQSTDEQYDFAAADEKEIQKLSNDNRVITPTFINSPAITVNFYNRAFYSKEKISELKPLSKQIVEMNLDNMAVKDEDLKIIADFTNLRRLNLNNSAITGATLSDLKKLVNLKSLSLSGTAVKASQLDPLVSLAKLRTVYLWNTEVADADVKKLVNENKNISYQTGFKGDTVTLKLNPPIAENEEQIILNDPILLKLKHYIQGTTLRYTLDGTDPDSIKSPVYDGKVRLDAAVTVKAKAYKPGWISSDIISEHFFKSTYRPDSVQLLTPADKKYLANGGKTINDLEKGDINNLAEGKWIGFRENAMEALLVFDKPIETKNVTVSAFKNIGGYIFPPATVEVWGGEKENDLKLLSKVVPRQPTKEEATKKDFVNREILAIDCNFKPVEVKFIKLLVKPIAKIPEWHEGKGQKAWTFVDEVFVN